jgi:hypothetical protein
MDDKVSKLKSIADLRDSGILSEREFKAEKAKIMAEPSVGQQPYGAPQQPYGAPQQPYGGPPIGQDPPVDEGFKILMYVVSFLFPIAGVVVGIIYNSKPELHHKEFGKNCLMIAIGTVVLGCFCYFIMMGAMFSTY